MRLYSHMSEEQSPPGNRTSCARAGPSGSSPKSTQKSGFNLRPPFTIFHCIKVHLKQHATFPVKKSVRGKMLQSIIPTSANLERELGGRSGMVAVE